MLMLALAGCRDSSADSAQAGNVAAPAPLDLPPAPLAIAEPHAPPVKPAPSPTVTVRAQPAPRNPLDLPASGDDSAMEPFPQEVTAFMVDRDGCDHFRGEQPHDAERRAFIAESVAELCTGTDARLAMLRRRYATDPSVIAALKGYEDRVEAPASF
nr:hypothetical protein [Sphingobium sp.]